MRPVIFVRHRVGFNVEQDRFKGLVVQRGRRSDHSFHRVYSEISELVVRVNGVPQRIRVVQTCKIISIN